MEENNKYPQQNTALLEKELTPELVNSDPIVQEELLVVSPKPPKNRLKFALILAGLGLGAIALGTVGHNYLQYASSHQSTDNATVVGHIHDISSRIPGTVTQVLVNDNQLVHKGQLLIKLDPQDYRVKVLETAAALENARSQASAAHSNISLASQTTRGKTTQAEGDINGAIAAISTANAAVKEAEAGIPAAQADVQLAEAGVSAAQSQVVQANANLGKAELDYRRYRDLYRTGAIARQQFDNAKTAYDVDVAQKTSALEGVAQAKAKLASSKVEIAQAQAKLSQAQENVVVAQAKLANTRGGLQQATANRQDTAAKRSQFIAAKAAIAQALASLKDAKTQLSYTYITAPTSGRIGRKNVEVGNQVTAGTPLMAIVDRDSWVVANFKETQLEKMHSHQSAEIELDTFPHHKFMGYVESMSPASGAQFALLPPDNATGNFTKVVQRIPVKIIFDQKSIQGYESRIVPGMSATVTVEVK